MPGAFTDDDFADEPEASTTADPQQIARARELLGKVVFGQVQLKDKSSAKFNVDGLKAASLLCRNDFKKSFPSSSLEDFVAAFKAAFQGLLEDTFG